MGRERTGAGELFHFCFAVLICCLIAGCGGPPKESSGVARQEIRPVAEASPQAEATPERALPEKIPQDALKQQKETIHRTPKPLERGDLTASWKEKLRIVSFAGKNPPKDQALFHQGLIWADTENPERDVSLALQSFKKMIKEYPQSPLAGEARVWIGILEENEKLNRMIEESKKVDMDVEEKKREKAR